jgi:hypothetical protein
MQKLNLEWKILDGSQVALIFDKTSWLAFQSTADSRGVDTCEMIAAAVVKLLGPVIATPSKG